MWLIAFWYGNLSLARTMRLMQQVKPANMPSKHSTYGVISKLNTNAGMLTHSCFSSDLVEGDEKHSSGFSDYTNISAQGRSDAGSGNRSSESNSDSGSPTEESKHTERARKRRAQDKERGISAFRPFRKLKSVFKGPNHDI